jgi:hypothetical protein
MGAGTEEDFSVEPNLTAMKYPNVVGRVLYASVQGVGPHGGRRTTAAGRHDRSMREISSSRKPLLLLLFRLLRPHRRQESCHHDIPNR